MRTAARLILLAATTLWAGAAMASEVAVKEAFTRATTSQATAGAAFMTLISPTADRLVAASSPVAERVELHTHIMEGGIARMREVEGGIELPAATPVLLQPGGLHIMLIGLKQPLKEGDTVQIGLTFANAAPVTVVVPVKSATHRPVAAADGHGHHGH